MPESFPRISVLLPAFNAGLYIREAIDSILHQTFNDFELLIADDGSTDDTRSIIDSYTDSRVRKYHNEKNIGKTATVNKLYTYAKGELITIHDADDMSMPERFERQVRDFDSDADLMLSGTGFLSIDRRGYVLEEMPAKDSYEAILREIQNASQFHGPTMMIRKRVLDQLSEIYRPYFKDYCEDTDLALRIVLDHKGYNVREPLYLYRILDTSLCRKDVDIRNRILYKIVIFLSEQRRTYGVDDLMDRKESNLDNYYNRLALPYAKDSTLIYHEAAAYYFYWHLYRKAFGAAWLAIKTNPMKFANYRLFLYLVRKCGPKQLMFALFKKHYSTIIGKKSLHHSQ